MSEIAAIDSRHGRLLLAVKRSHRQNAISTLPLVTSLQVASTVKQCWFADDASGAGRVTQIREWWDALNILGPNLHGIFSKSEKCWKKEESVREAFHGTAICITAHGQKHLEAALDSREYLEEYVNQRVCQRSDEVVITSLL